LLQELLTYAHCKLREYFMINVFKLQDSWFSTSFPNGKNHVYDQDLQIAKVLYDHVFRVASVLSLIKGSKLHEFCILSRFWNLEKKIRWPNFSN
jgi:hypothetical protein